MCWGTVSGGADAKRPVAGRRAPILQQRQMDCRCWLRYRGGERIEKDGGGEKRWLKCVKAASREEEEKKTMYMFSKITFNVPFLLVFCQFARLNLSWRPKFGWLRPKEGAAGLWRRRATKKNGRKRAEEQLTSSRKQIYLNVLV